MTRFVCQSHGSKSAIALGAGFGTQFCQGIGDKYCLDLVSVRIAAAREEGLHAQQPDCRRRRLRP